MKKHKQRRLYMYITLRIRMPYIFYYRRIYNNTTFLITQNKQNEKKKG